MKKLMRLLILLFLFSHVVANAQGIDERVYVQTDRNYYSSGETIFFKGYIISGSNAEILSSNLFVELWDSATQRIANVCVPVIDGTASGSITIPAVLQSSRFFLRAFTDITVLQNLPYQFIKNITGNTSDLQKETAGLPVFFPEGGKFVYNAENYIAFKVPVNFSGDIKSDKGEIVAHIRAEQTGLGFFKMLPIPGEKYFCHWQANGKDEVLPLPVPVEEGIAVHVYQSKDTLHFDLDNGGTQNLSIRKPKVQLLINNEVVYLVGLNMISRNRYSYFIPLGDFQPAVAELRVVDSTEKILASRPLFIVKKCLDTGISMEIQKKDLSQRAESIIKLNFQDTLLRDVSVSVTDAALNDSPRRTGFVSALFPSGFTSSSGNKPGGTSPELLDLSLLLAGNTAEKSSRMDTTAPSIPQYLQLKGLVKKGRKPVANKEVFVGIRSELYGKELYKVQTDEQGRFLLDGLIVYDEVFVHCRLPGKSDEELTTEFSLSLPTVKEDSGFINKFKAETGSKLPVVAVVQNKILQQDTIVYSDKTKVLEEVIVRADQEQLARKRLYDIERKYVDGTVFSGYFVSGETIDVMNDPQAAKLTDLFSYIASKMFGVTQSYSGGRKNLVYENHLITTFYVNNSKWDRDLVDGIKLSEVAAVKIVKYLGSERGMPCALGIFLKKEGDQGYWEKDKFILEEHKITGYPVLKDYQSPDYNKADIKVEKDFRKTLLWQPYTRVDKGTAEIRFFNNDRTKKIRIVVEGVTQEGNIVFFERELE